MAEIKSAIELAMERTKNLVMDEEEKRRFARRDIEDRLKAIMRRLLEGMIDRERFVEEYRGITADKSEKRMFLADLVIEAFEASHGNDRFFDLLEFLGEDAGSGREAKALKAGFESELKAREKSIREGIVARLRAMEISGSAVEPNVPEWKEWKDGAREIAASFKQRLVEWKNRVLANPA